MLEIALVNRRPFVPILKIHRLLIGSGIAVCLLYTGRQMADYFGSGGPGALLRALASLLGATTLGLYLYTIRSR